MGGGAAMRVVAKVAGIGGVFNRGSNPVAAAVRQATGSVAAVVSSSDDVKLIANSSQKNESPVVQTAQGPYWEIDDWETAGGVEDELFMDRSGESMGRLVFGGAPTIQEAKEATSELNDVLEKTYLSPKASGLAGSLVSGQEPCLSFLSNPESLETKTCLLRETPSTPPAPKHAIQAFKLLSESPAAQTVVASIASDPNVWHAVMQNEVLVEYLQSHKTSVIFPEMNPSESVEDLVADAESPNPESPKCSDESYDSKESVPGKGFMDYVEDIKQKIRASVVEMMNTLSDTFQNLFVGAPKGESLGNNDGAAARSALGTSFMALAVMVIMVVVLKRG